MAFLHKKNDYNKDTKKGIAIKVHKRLPKMMV